MIENISRSNEDMHTAAMPENDKEEAKRNEDQNQTSEPQADTEATSSDRPRRRQGNFGNREQHAAAGKKGGQAVSRNREHMAAIGRMGGLIVSKNRDHMASIGRKGGKA